MNVEGATQRLLGCVGGASARTNLSISCWQVDLDGVKLIVAAIGTMPFATVHSGTNLFAENEHGYLEKSTRIPITIQNEDEGGYEMITVTENEKLKMSGWLTG